VEAALVSAKNWSSGHKAYSVRRSPSYVQFFFVGVALIPLIILILEVSRYAVDIPFWDQWNFVPLLGKAFDGQLRASDLWAQHNEHRLLFPRLIMLGLAKLSGYNICFELGANILLATGILILIIWQFFRSAKALNLKSAPWILPIFSLLVYSLNQGENWLWGWQIQIFLNVVAVVGGCLLLGNLSERLSWSRLGGAMMTGLGAVYSFANGLIFWALGLVALLILQFKTRKEKGTALVVWSLVMASVFLSYFYRFHFDSPSGEPWAYFLKHPAQYTRYVLQYLGAAIINYEEYAFLFGLGGLLFFGGMSALLWRRRGGLFRPILPFFFLGLYAVGCAMLTGSGRVGFGTVQAMSYRYVTFSSLLWVANFVYFLVLLELTPKMLKKRMARVSSRALILFLVFLLLLGAIRTSYRVGHRVFVSHHRRLAPVYFEFRRNPTPGDELLFRLYVDADYVRQGINILKKHGLSVFRKPWPRVPSGGGDYSAFLP